MQRLVCLLLVAVSVQAWVPPPIPSCALKSKNKNNRVALVWSSRSEEEESTSASFDDAGQKIVEQENEEMAANMEREEEDDEFEERSKEYDAIRAAIRERTSEIGIEKSVVTAKLIEEANARAAAGQQVTGLDLSQITGAGFDGGGSMGASGDDGESMGLPTMAEDLEAQFQELTPEERKRIDPTDGEGWFERVKYEFQFVEWPTTIAIFKEVGLVMLCVAIMAAVIINWDRFLRDTYTEYGMIPRPEDVTQQFEGLKLPEGWTDGLTDQDVVSVPDVE